LSSRTLLRDTKGNIAIEQKTRKKGYREDDDKCCDMWGDNHNTKVHVALKEYVVVYNEIPHSIKRHINSPTDEVPESLT
jgi:hypothetical protein